MFTGLAMTEEPAEPSIPTPQEFDRMMNAKVQEWGSRHDGECPACHRIGFRLIADSEFTSLFACRHCGHQAEELHAPGTPVAQPFREYREGRGLRAAHDDEAPEAPP